MCAYCSKMRMKILQASMKFYIQTKYYMNNQKLLPIFLVYILLLFTGCQIKQTTIRTLQQTSFVQDKTVSITAQITDNRLVKATMTATQAPKQRSTGTLNPSVTTSPFPSKTPTATETDRKEEPHLTPDVLIELNSGFRDMCMLSGRDDVWLATYPYDAVQPILANSDIDYRFPTCSPDVKWLLFVESKPVIIPEEILQETAIITGTDTVWVMRPDGSDRHIVSDSLPSAMFSHSMGVGLACDIYAQIVSPPQWSPDGRFIIFNHMSISSDMRLMYTYYLTDVTTGATNKVISQEIRGNITWTPRSDQLILLDEHGEFTKIVIESISDIEIRTLPINFPGEVTHYNNIRIAYFENEQQVIVYVQSGGDNFSPIPKQLSVWRIDLVTSQWEKIVDIQKTTWSFPQKGEMSFMWCDSNENEFSFFDLDTWSQLGNTSIEKQAKIDINCAHNEIVMQKGNEWIVFSGYTDRIQTGIWYIPIQMGEDEPKLLLNLSSVLNMAPGIEKYLGGFDIRP